MAYDPYGQQMGQYGAPSAPMYDPNMNPQMMAPHMQQPMGPSAADISREELKRARLAQDFLLKISLLKALWVNYLTPEEEAFAYNTLRMTQLPRSVGDHHNTIKHMFKPGAQNFYGMVPMAQQAVTQDAMDAIVMQNVSIAAQAFNLRHDAGMMAPPIVGYSGPRTVYVPVARPVVRPMYVGLSRGHYYHQHHYHHHHRPAVVVGRPMAPVHHHHVAHRPAVVVTPHRPAVVVAPPRPAVVVAPPRPAVVVAPRPAVVVAPRPAVVVAPRAAPIAAVKISGGGGAVRVSGGAAFGGGGARGRR